MTNGFPPDSNWLGNISKWQLRLLLMICLASQSCGSRTDGPQRYDLSGAVLYSGKPIPEGSIVFEPDDQQGNFGPASVADIHNGQFQTRPGKGHVGGPHRVVIYGYDGTRPKSMDADTSLFPPFETTMDLPARVAQQDIAIPESTN